jgi:hypothetical protein
MDQRKLTHEVWEDFDAEGQSLPGLCLSGPLGDGFRSMLGPNARLLTTIEAGSHFEVMTLYYRLMGWGEYTTDQAWDRAPYPEDWFEVPREA